MSKRTLETNPECTISVSAKTVGVSLAAIIALLLLADIAGQILVFHFGNPNVAGLVRIFDLDSEVNAPTWFSASVMLIAAMVLAAIATGKRQVGDRYARHWIGLAVGFVYLSADEAAGLHEAIGPFFAGAGRWLTVHVSNYFAYLGAYPVYTWVLPASIAVAAVAWSYFGFLMALPLRTRILVVVSGLLFIIGAMGVEVLGARSILLSNGHPGPDYAALVAIEETLEMAGMSLFLFTLLKYAESEIVVMRLQFGETVRETGTIAQIDTAGRRAGLR